MTGLVVKHPDGTFTDIIKTYDHKGGGMQPLTKYLFAGLLFAVPAFAQETTAPEPIITESPGDNEDRYNFEVTSCIGNKSDNQHKQ